MNVDSQLKGIIEARGLKQTWLAKQAGVSTTAMGSIVNARSVPSLAIALRIAAVLDLRVEDIWRLDPEI